MRNQLFLRRLAVFLPSAFCMLIILSTSFAQDADNNALSSFSAEDQSEFVPVGTGEPSLVELRLGSGINQVFTPPPSGYQRAPQTAFFNVNFNPASCASSTLADVTPWPTEAKAAFTFATNIWGTLINSSVPVEIDACWRPLGPGVLGSAGPLNIFTDNVALYPVALANALEDIDLDPGTSDIQANFSSEFNWYLGIDGNTPGSQLDFASVILHEIGHGLGFSGSMEVGRVTTGGPLVARWGFGGALPFAYDQYVENGAGQSLVSSFPNTSVALYQQVTSNNLVFDGPFSRAANGNSAVPLYAPSQWQQGSSYSHLSETFNNTQNALMTYSLDSGEARHSPGPVGLGLLNDVGWSRTGSIDFVPTDFLFLPIALK